MLEQHLEITTYYYSFLVRFCIFMSRCSFLICVCIVIICKFGVRDVLEIRLKKLDVRDDCQANFTALLRQYRSTGSIAGFY